MSLRPGPAFLWVKQKFGNGLKVAWYRDVVRPKILRTEPTPDTFDNTCEIHVLTSNTDWLNLIWTLKSFYKVSERKYRLCIHEDGSLDDEALFWLQQHFPAARLIRRKEADLRLAHVLRDYRLSLDFRNSNLLAPKVFDFMAFLESDRMALFDSDLLFFSKPSSYIERIESKAYQVNTFNTDVGNGYTVEPSEVRARIGHDLVPRINSGLGLVHRDSIRWDWTEEFLALPKILDGNPWRIEQTLFALCSSRYGVEHLPDEYAISLEPGFKKKPFRHYVGKIRHLMYSEGMAHLAKEGFLRAA